MSLSTQRAVFGIFSISPYNPTSGLFYGTSEIAGECAMNLAGEVVELTGGASKYPYRIEDGIIKAELSAKIREYPDWLFEIFLGKAPTTAGVDTGSVTTLTNVLGSLVASVGLASVSVKSGSEADLKFGTYIVKATDATHVDVYCSSRVDFARGTDKDFENDALKITASPLAITASTATDVPGFGIKVTGGSGTIGMTAGNTASFQVLPPNSASMYATIGSPTDTYPEFGMVMYSAKMGTGEIVEIDAFRCKAIGAPIKFAEKSFSETDLAIKCRYDSAKNGVFKVRHFVPT